MPRTEIEIVTTGLPDILKAVEALTAFEARLLSVKEAGASLGGAFQPLSRSMGGMGTSAVNATARLLELEKTLASLKAQTEGTGGGMLRITTGTAGAGRAATGAQRDFGSLLGTLVKYQAISAVFGAVTTSVHDAIGALKDYDYQAARTTRITGGSRAQVASQLRLGASMTGLDPQVAGEAYYQLGTFIHGAADQAKVFRNEMELINGTEGDARQTARASIQVYEDFGNQLGKNTSVAEKFRRANELIAISFKSSNAEVDELSNALKYLAPTAQTAGLAVEQLFAVMTTLTSQGVRGRMEGTEAGSFITRLIKAYNDGVGGIEKGTHVYHFDFARDAKGGLDLIRTLEDIHRRYEDLKRKNVAAAQEYITAIGGTAQAIRFLGSMSDETLGRMRSETAKNVTATHGLTHEVEGLNREINNTASKQQARAWQTFLGTLSGGLMEVYNALSRIQGLHNLVKSMQVDLANNASMELRSQDLLGHGSMSPLQQTQSKLSSLRSALDIGTHIPTQWWNTSPNVNHIAGDISVEALRQSPRFKGAGEADLNAILQLLPNRSAPLDLLEFGPGRHERYVTKEDLIAAIGKVTGDVRKMQVATTTHNTGVLSVQDLASVALKAGFSRENLATAVAIAMAESGGQVKQVSQNQDRMHTHDRGLWQINSFWHQEVPDAEAFDPAGNAAAAFRISGGGSDWRQWTTYRNGAYKKFLPQVLGALGAGVSGAGGGSYGGPSITDKPEDPDKAAADRQRAAIDALHDRIDMDRARLTLIEAHFDGEEGLGAFKRMAPEIDAVGRDWRAAQAALARQEHNPATLMLLASTEGDFSDYGQYRQSLKDKMIKAGEKSAEDAAQEHKDAVEERKDALSEKLQALIDSVTEGAQSASDRFERARRPEKFGLDQDQDQMTMLTGQRSVRQQSASSLLSLMVSRAMAGEKTPPKELMDAYKEEVKSLDEVTKSIQDLTDTIAGKKMEKFIENLGKGIEMGLSVLPHFTPIPGTVSSGAFQAGENAYLDFINSGDSAFKTGMSAFLGPMAEAGMNMKAGGTEPKRKTLGITEGDKGGPFGFGSYSYGGYGEGGKGAISGVPGDLKQFGTLAGLFGKTGGEIGQGANILAGAFGIANQGAQQGITIGNVLSGATQGAEIGSMFGPEGTLIGAAAGGLLDVIGGLFHSHHADPGTFDTNVNQSNSPSNFDYMAYRYRATGSSFGLGGPQQRYFNSNTAPVVNVYVDNVKTQVQTQISAATSPGNAALTSVFYDAQRPV